MQYHYNMSTPSDGIWHTLPAIARTQNEPLLARWRSDKNGYSVQITNLKEIWTEVLTKDDIITRANDEGCSIDPSEDDNQYQILLSKLEDGFHGNKKSILTIDDHAYNENIQIQVESELPRPLQPLRWTLSLIRDRVASISSDFIMPLLRSSYIQHQRVEELSRLLTEKDLAVSKLLDKVESMGVDLSSLYPNLGKSVRRDKQREHLAKSVRGLQTFDKEDFMASFATKQADAADLNTLVHDAFAGGASMDKANPGEVAEKTGNGAKGSRQKIARTQSSEDQNDGFQVNYTSKISVLVTSTNSRLAASSNPSKYQEGCSGANRDAIDSACSKQ